jgi:hypothetical protein
MAFAQDDYPDPGSGQTYAGSGQASPLPPAAAPSQPPKDAAAGCRGGPASTPDFGIPGSPDSPRLNCGSSSPVPASSSAAFKQAVSDFAGSGPLSPQPRNKLSLPATGSYWSASPAQAPFIAALEQATSQNAGGRQSSSPSGTKFGVPLTPFDRKTALLTQDLLQPPEANFPPYHPVVMPIIRQPAQIDKDRFCLSPKASVIYDKFMHKDEFFEPLKQDKGHLSCVTDLKSEEKAKLIRLQCDLRLLEAKLKAKGVELDLDQKLMAAWWSYRENIWEASEAAPSGYVNCSENPGENSRNTKQHNGVAVSKCTASFWSGGWQVGWGNQVFDGTVYLKEAFELIYGHEENPSHVAKSVLDKTKAELPSSNDALNNLKLSDKFNLENWDWKKLVSIHKSVQDAIEKTDRSVQAKQKVSASISNEDREKIFMASIIMRDPVISAYLVIKNDVKDFNCYGKKPAKWCRDNGYLNPDVRKDDAKKMLKIIRSWPDLEQQHCPLHELASQ